MKAILLLLLLTAFYKQALPITNHNCGVQKPLQELIWLKKKVAEYKSDGGSLRIMQAQYRGEIVFSIEYIQGLDARSTIYYHCNGWEICQTSVTIAGFTSMCGDFPGELTERKTVYPEVAMK